MKYFRIFLSSLIIVAIILTFTIGITKIKEKKPLIGQENSYIGIINLWHIDSFEGGLGSRKQFLLDTAVEFEKSYNGIYVNVTNHTVDSVENCFRDGVYPDMISYGIGVEIKNVVELDLNFDFNGGKLNNKTFALPWCSGGYALITKQNLNIDKNNFDSITVSKSNFNNPKLALYLEEIVCDNIIEKKPLDAYVDFVSGKADYFLGSQRDIIRLSGRGVAVKIRPLKNYNDYYQYISVLSKDEEIQRYSNEFIKLLLSEKIQLKLPKIGMLSVFYDTENQFEGLNLIKEPKNQKTLFALIGKNGLDNINENLSKAIKGETDAKINIKNVLI